MVMNTRKHTTLWLLSLAVLLTLAMSIPAQAHHVMGGKMPSSFAEGLLSGLGHPVIGLDHLAFIIAVGVAVGMAGLSLVIPVLFIAASAIGVAGHVSGISLPGSEALVALSVLVAGAIIAFGRSLQLAAWAALFAIGGLLHGYAFGESIYGAEPSPLVAYLIGLAAIQAVLATAVAWAVRRTGAEPLGTRLAGATIAGIGIAILAGQFLPA